MNFRKVEIFLSGGGGLCSTISDYANFCQMLLNKGIFNGNRILSPTTIDFMTQNHLQIIILFKIWVRVVLQKQDLTGAGFGLGFPVIIDQVRSAMPASVGSFSWGGMASTFFGLIQKRSYFLYCITSINPLRKVSLLDPQAPNIGIRSYK